MSTTVYVSSPLGFSWFGRIALNTLYTELSTAGFRVETPWDWPNRLGLDTPVKTANLLLTAGIAGEGRDWAVSQEIAARNVTLLRGSDVVLAILDGADVDSGVAAEVGYAAAIEKPVIGLRTDERSTTDSPGYVVNLQITHLIAHSGPPAGRVTTSLPEAIAALRDVVRGEARVP